MPVKQKASKTRIVADFFACAQQHDGNLQCFFERDAGQAGFVVKAVGFRLLQGLQKIVNQILCVLDADGHAQEIVGNAHQCTTLRPHLVVDSVRHR
jgi:hypothetical protein